jgi:hypothetical protein
MWEIMRSYINERKDGDRSIVFHLFMTIFSQFVPFHALHSIPFLSLSFHSQSVTITLTWLQPKELQIHCILQWS